MTLGRRKMTEGSIPVRRQPSLSTHSHCRSTWKVTYRRNDISHDARPTGVDRSRPEVAVLTGKGGDEGSAAEVELRRVVRVRVNVVAQVCGVAGATAPEGCHVER